MTMKTLSLVVLIPTILATNINVKIIASHKNSERKSSATGSDTRIISDIELETFQLYDGKLKDAIQAYHGKKPDDVYLKSRTPWGDLYTTYGWSQVSRTLTPVKTDIFFVEYLPVEITSLYFNNTDMKDVNRLFIRKDMENTVKSLWTVNGDLARVNINYDVNMKAKFGDTAFNYESKWGESVVKSSIVTLGPEKEVNVILTPDQRAKATLMATKGNLKVRINYEAVLSGNVAVNYNESYKGHHFFSMDIASVLNAGRLNWTAYFTEELTIDYYSDYEIVLTDLDTKQKLLSTFNVFV